MVTTIAYLPLRPNWWAVMWLRFMPLTSHRHLLRRQRPKRFPLSSQSGADPVKVGLVDSLSRPKGNLTGVSAFLSVLGPKHVELLHELLPAANTIAFLANPGNVNIKTDEPEIRAAADRLKQHLEVLTASTESDLEAAFATMVERGVGGLIVKPDPFFIHRRERASCAGSPPRDACDLST